MKKPVKKMRRDRIYYRLAGGDNIIICTVDHKTHKVTKKKECKYVTLDGDGPLIIEFFKTIDAHKIIDEDITKKIPRESIETYARENNLNESLKRELLNEYGFNY